MKSPDYSGRQGGVVLVVALLFLLVVTVISVIAASNSAMGLKMSANLQDSYASFQSAEAGVVAVLALANGANDPFDGLNTPDIFNSADPAYWACTDSGNPLANVSKNNGACLLDVDVFMTNAGTACPRSATGSSVGLFECDFYRIESEHEAPKQARTKVQLGVVKTIIGSGNI